MELGAGALGFNFYPPSPRSIPLGSSDSELDWVKDLSKLFPGIVRIAVVVNPEARLLQQLQKAGCFEAIQFHGDETPEFSAAEGAAFPHWIKALRIRTEEDLAIATQFQTPFLLLDAAVKGGYGGSGQTLDWTLAARFVASNPNLRVILAGGLNPTNVAAAVKQVRPHAVDVASGVESSPGHKDPVKMRAFFSALSATS